MSTIPEIDDEMRAQAALQPGGYIYCIDPAYAVDGVDGDIPPQGIIGAYPIDNDGNIINEFQANPNYREYPVSP